MMEIKKISFDSRNGYSLEWHDPKSLRLTRVEAIMILASIKADLDPVEVEQNFDDKERECLKKYNELHQDKLSQMIEKFATKNMSRLQSQLKFELEAALDAYRTDAYIDHYLEWQTLGALDMRDNIFLNELKHHEERQRDKAYFIDKINKMGMPGPYVIGQIEKIFGSLGLRKSKETK